MRRIANPPAPRKLGKITLLSIMLISMIGSAGLWASDQASQANQAVLLTLGADLPNSPIRPLLGVNDGPAPAGDAGNADLTAQYQQIGVTLIRTHDFYGPLDMATIFPNQNADPADPGSYNFTASDQTFASIIEGGFEPYLRLGDSYNDVRLITNPSHWVQAAVEVVRHYNDATRWGASHLHDVEIWNEPDNSHFWLGSRSDFFALFAQAAMALKAAFPALKIGGPGLTPAGFKSPQGQNFTRGFLESMKASRIPLDFFSWHMYSNDPADFINAAKFYRDLLDSNGYTATESHISEWNTEYREGPDADAAVRTGAKGAALMSAAWIGLQQQGVAAAAFYRGNDPSLNAPTWYGIFYADGRPKPVGLAFGLWSQMAAHPLRYDLAVGNAASASLVVLASHNASSEIALLIVNPTSAALSWQLVLPAPSGASLTATLQQISGAAQSIETSTLSGLSSEIGSFTTQLVLLKP